MSEEYGTLFAGGRRPRKIDQWKFRSPFMGKIGGTESAAAGYVADIYLKNDRNSSVDNLLFIAKSKHFEKDLETSDIEELRVMVLAAFSRVDMAKHDIVWEDWFEIEIEDGHQNYRNEDGSGITFTFKRMKRGVNPTTGEPYLLSDSGVVMEFPKPKRAGVEDVAPPGEKWFRSREEGHEFSYVQATPANTAALESLRDRINELRGRLNTLLQQKAVQKSLAGEVNKLLTMKGDSQ
jgi:hypothetical protein